MYDGGEGKYRLEKCCEEFEIEPAPCDDEGFSAVVELSPLHVLGESAGLYKDDDWDGTMEISYKGGKVCGSIEGIGYRDIDGNPLPSGKHKTVLISARSEGAEGAGILMINPIAICLSSMILSEKKEVEEVRKAGDETFQDIWDRAVIKYDAALWTPGTGSRSILQRSLLDKGGYHRPVKVIITSQRLKARFNAGSLEPQASLAILLASFSGCWFSGERYVPGHPCNRPAMGYDTSVRCIETGFISRANVASYGEIIRYFFEMGDVTSFMGQPAQKDFELRMVNEYGPSYEPLGLDNPLTPGAHCETSIAATTYCGVRIIYIPAEVE